MLFLSEDFNQLRELFTNLIGLSLLLLLLLLLLLFSVSKYTQEKSNKDFK